jgi:hypothetical protein
MIRRDYILRMLAEFFEVLSRMRSLKNEQRWNDATLLAEKEFQRLIGVDAQAAVHLSETDLLARLIRSESTLAVREKTLILSTLLKEAGDLAAGRNEPDASRGFYLKGLDLLLGVLAHEQITDFPEFVPRVDGFLGVLGDDPLPLSTLVMLMQYFEQAAEFGRAEDILFDMLALQPENPELRNFGIAFYRRLQSQSDDALVGGNLPRSEIEAGLAQLLAGAGK